MWWFSMVFNGHFRNLNCLNWSPCKPITLGPWVSDAQLATFHLLQLVDAHRRAPCRIELPRSSFLRLRRVVMESLGGWWWNPWVDGSFKGDKNTENYGTLLLNFWWNELLGGLKETLGFSCFRPWPIELNDQNDYWWSSNMLTFNSYLKSNNPRW